MTNPADKGGPRRTRTVRHDELAFAEDAIRSVLDEAERDPMEVVASLRAKGLSEFAVREAIWRLIDAGEVTLTSKRMLVQAKVPA
jgi:hypothetical protein